MSSWDALSWAKKQHAGSPLAKSILILICARADERFSCMPKVAELADEAEASRSGVQAALATLRKELTWTERVETPDGDVVEQQRRRPPLLATEEQFLPGSGAQDRNRYLINHPDAPHMTAPTPVDHAATAAMGGPAIGRGGPSHRAGGAQPSGGGGPATRPPRAQPPGGGRPLSGHQSLLVGGGGTTTTTDATPNELADVVVVEAQKNKIRLTRSVVQRVCGDLVVVGWTPTTLGADLRARSWQGIQGGAVIAWLRDLATTKPPEPEAPPRQFRAPWCGYCSHPEKRTRIDSVTGNVTSEPCPDCGGA